VKVLLREVRVGLPREIDEIDPWRSAFLKEPVAGRIELASENLAGDRQADLSVHGGPDKAVCVYSADHYPAWRRELRDVRSGPGWFGENFSIEGQAEETVCVGDAYRVGTAVVEVSQPRGPCWKLGRRWGRIDMPKLALQTGRTGWYFRVRETGGVAAGDELTLEDRPYPRWTIDTVNRLMHAKDRDRLELKNARLALANCPALAAGWREALRD
jgi:MOSC domain-containing protein YiiM